MADVAEEGGFNLCPECGSSEIVRDYARGQVVCGECGYIMREKIKDRSPEWRSFNQGDEDNRSRAGPPTTLAKHDKGLFTEIGGIRRDGKGNPLSPDQRRKLGRMRKWNRRSRINGAGGRTLRDALSCIKRVCSYAALSGNIKDRAAHLYRRAVKADLVRGRSSEAVVAAVVYVACAEAEIPVGLEDIADAAEISVRKASRAHGIVVRELKLEFFPVSPERYISGVVEKLADEFHLPLLERRRAQVREIVQEAKKRNLHQNRLGRSLVAAAVYMVIKHLGYQRPVGRVASATGLSRGAVQGAVAQLDEGLDDDVISRIVNNSEEEGEDD